MHIRITINKKQVSLDPFILRLFKVNCKVKGFNWESELSDHIAYWENENLSEFLKLSEHLNRSMALDLCSSKCLEELAHTSY